MKYMRKENILNKKREGKRSLVKPTSKWENNTILILNKQGGNERIGFALLRAGIGNSRILVNTFHLRRENPTSSMTMSSLRNQFQAVRCNLLTPMMTKQAVSEMGDEIRFGCGLGCLPHSYFQRRTQSH